MNRVIKFRAWFDDGKAQSMFFVGDEYGTTHDLDCCRCAQQGQPVTLMQFTGLCDKNGVEIYESDIIARADDHSLNCVVKWEHKKEFRGMADGYVEHRIGFAFDEYFFTLENCEVIGNIYQNPELLNG